MSEKIEVGYRHIGTQMGKEFHHKFLLYTNNQGQQYTISGWSDKNNATAELPYGKITVLYNEPYNYKNPDYPKQGNDAQNIYFEKITEGDNLKNTWIKMQNSAVEKHNIYPYDPIKQNSNSLADSVLKDVGLPSPKEDGFGQHWAPASDKKLDINLIPQDPQLNGVSKNLGNVISETDVNNWQHNQLGRHHKSMKLADSGIDSVNELLASIDFTPDEVAHLNKTITSLSFQALDLDYQNAVALRGIETQTNELLQNQSVAGQKPQTFAESLKEAQDEQRQIDAQSRSRGRSA
jgi:hypothetical protein